MINPKSFLILDDVKFYSFDINGAVVPVSRRIRENVKNLIQCLNNNVRKIIIMDGKTIVSKISDAIDQRYFVITLDNQTYFCDSNFSFGLSRTANTPKQISDNDYSVQGRLGLPTPTMQAQQIARLYERDGRKRPIILCDDGIGTGGTLEKAVTTLASQNLTIHRICVVVNPNDISRVANVEVATLYQDTSNFCWLNSRDLIFGGPRSGATYAPPEPNQRVYGIPYIIDVNMIKNRIGVFGEHAKRFRECCLNINIQLWQELEHTIVNTITVKDCSRIAILGEMLNCSDQKITDFLQDINYPDFSLATAINAGSTK